MDIVKRPQSTKMPIPNRSASLAKNVRQPQSSRIAISSQKNNTSPTPSALPQHHTVETFDEYIRRTKITEKPRRCFSFGKWIFWLAFIAFFASILWAGYAVLHKTNETLARISDDKEQPSVMKALANIANPHSYKTLNGFDSGRINILLLGRANTHKSGKDLTDTIMVASINTTNYTIGLFSIPRDLLVQTDYGYVKINSVYQTGLRNNVGADHITNIVQDITGQTIHYYVVMDFEGFIKIIDTLEGINVDVPSHIKDERYPGPGYSYETFEVYPGLQKFNGETALKYARTRHDAEGDFGRAKRQQQIMQSAKNKAFSLGTIVNPMRIAEIFDVLGDHIHTNISPNEIEPFIALIKKLDTQNITTVVIDAWQPGSLLMSTRQYGSGGGISGLTPRTGNYKEIRERAELIFDLQKIAQREKDIHGEEPTITLINTTSDTDLPERVSGLLKKIGFQSITVFSDPKNKKIVPQETTVIVDRTSGSKPFSLDELIKKVPATKGATDIDKKITSDFAIMLGNDILNTYTYTEISRDELEQENLLNTNEQ